MENSTSYQQVRRSRILVNVFLLLTIASVLIATHYYTQLRDSKRALEKEKNAVIIARDSIQSLKDTLAISKAALDAAIDSINQIVMRCPPSVIEEVGSIIETAKVAARDNKYQAVLALERQAFQSILQNDFERAIVLLKEANAIYPKVHNIYDIQNYLSRNKRLFESEAGRKKTKKRS